MRSRKLSRKRSRTNLSLYLIRNIGFKRTNLTLKKKINMDLLQQEKKIKVAICIMIEISTWLL